MGSKKIRVVRATGERMVGEHMQDLSCPLTDQEQRMRGLELAQLEEEQRRIDTAFASVKADHKAKTENLVERREMLAQIVRDKREKRPVRVESWARYDRARYEEIRTDTGELVSERALMPGEMQEELPLDGATA